MMYSDRFVNALLNRDAPASVWLLDRPGRIALALSIGYAHALDASGQSITQTVQIRGKNETAYRMIREEALNQ